MSCARWSSFRSLDDQWHVWASGRTGVGRLASDRTRGPVARATTGACERSPAHLWTVPLVAVHPLGCLPVGCEALGWGALPLFPEGVRRMRLQKDALRTGCKAIQSKKVITGGQAIDRPCGRSPPLCYCLYPALELPSPGLEPPSSRLETLSKSPPFTTRPNRFFLTKTADYWYPVFVHTGSTDDHLQC